MIPQKCWYFYNKMKVCTCFLLLTLFDGHVTRTSGEVGIAPPMPGEELSVEVFDLDRRKRQKALSKSNSTIRPKSTLNEDAQVWPADLRKAIPSRVNTSDVRDNDLRRNIAPPMHEEDLSINVFDREERKRQKSLAKSNRITNAHHGIKAYIKRMRNLQNTVHALKKIDDYNQNSRMNVISNGYKGKNVVDEYEANKSRNKVREPKRGVKKTSSVNEDGQEEESNKEIVKNNDRHTYNLKNKKKATRSETTKATKSSKSVQSLKNSVQIYSEPLSTAKNNAGNTTDNDNFKKLTKTTFKVTKKVHNATLNVIEEVKPKRIKMTTDDYVTKDNPTRRYRRVLEFSSPPLYDQPFFDYDTFQKGLHPALKKMASVLSLTRPRIV